MLKKTSALVIGTLLTTSCAWAQMLIHLNLTTATNSLQQQLIVNENEEAACQLENLLFEVKANKQDNNVNMTVKIFNVAGAEKIFVASPEFTTELGKAASLTLEKEGQPAELTIVPVDIV
jgi:hypothetical protein